MFVCTVSQDHMTFETLPGASSHTILVPVGYDIDDGRDSSYFAAVGLDVLAGGGCEIFFSIMEFDHTNNSRYEYWSGRETSSFILGSDRDDVLNAVCCAVQMLIDSGAPDEIEISTHDANPPDKAVIKHFRVMSVFERNGYHIRTFDPYHGRRIWLLTREKA